MLQPPGHCPSISGVSEMREALKLTLSSRTLLGWEPALSAYSSGSGYSTALILLLILLPSWGAAAPLQQNFLALSTAARSSLLSGHIDISSMSRAAAQLSFVMHSAGRLLIIAKKIITTK